MGVLYLVGKNTLNFRHDPNISLNIWKSLGKCANFTDRNYLSDLCLLCQVGN